MATRLTLLCHAATRSMREGGFPSPDEPVDAPGAAKAAGLHAGKGPVFIAPERAARETSEILGQMDSFIDTALRDIDHGQWSGRSFADVHATEPDAFAAWLTDPTIAAPGGESFAALVSRLSAWLELRALEDRAIRVIAAPMVIRAALAAALDLPHASALRIDIAPLSSTTLSFNRLWRLQSLCPA